MYAQFFVIFAYVVSGIVLRQMNIISVEAVTWFNKLILKFALPCMLMYNIAVLEVNDNVINNFITCLCLTLLSFAVCQMYAYFVYRLRKYPHSKRGVIELSIIIPNNGFMGFPIAFAFFDDMGLVMMVAANIAMNLYLYSIGYIILDRNNTNVKMNKWNLIRQTMTVFKNPIIIAAIIGFIILFAGIELPVPVLDYLEQGSGICTPLSMICIGINIPVRELFSMLKTRMILEVAVDKLIITPFIVLCAMYFLPISPIVKAICVLSTAMPTAVVTPALEEEKGQDAVLGSKLVVVTSAFSMVTILACISIINLLIM